MKIRHTIFWAAALFTGLTAATVRGENWPQWRGPRMDGTSTETKIPTTWSPTENIAWKTPLPGVGHASPIVWEDRVFLVTAVTNEQARLLLCLDRKTGALLWQKHVLTSPLEGKNKLNSFASSTPATDGQRVFTAFLDVSNVVITAHDFTGKQVWQARPGVFSSKHGFCSSLIIHGDKVIANADHDGDGYMVALSRADGRQLWRIERPNKTRSYVPPVIFPIGKAPQMVLSGTKCVTSYDPETGKLNWIIDGPTEQFVASMVYSSKADLLYITGGFPEHHLLAIDPHGQGNVTQTHIKWRTTQGAGYVPSPIVEGDYLLNFNDDGIVHCFKAATGELVWKQNTGKEHASLCSANGLVYLLNDNGVTLVVRPGPEFKTVAKNEIGETCFASPAFSQGQIFVRGDRHLFCIGQAR